MNQIKENISNIVQTVIASIAGCNPLLAAGFSSYSTYCNNVAHKAIYKIMNDLSCKIKEIECSIDQDYFLSDEFKALAYRTFTKAATEIRNEKLEVFTNFLTHSALLKEVEISDKYMFLESLDKIDLEHIYFLNKLSCKNALDDIENIKGWQGIDKELVVLGVNKERFTLLCDYLANIGLVSRIEKFKVEEGTLYMTREYFVSTYGIKLLQFTRDSKRNI